MLCQKEKQIISARGRESLLHDVASLKDIMQGYRREFHRNPELSMQELAHASVSSRFFPNWG